MVTDAELDAAAEETPDTQDVSLESEEAPEKALEDEELEAKPDEDTEAEDDTETEVQDEPDDHRERSQLGRRVKLMEETVSSVNENLAQIAKLIQSTNNVQEETADDLDLDGEDFIAKKDVAKYIDERMTKREQASLTAKTEYENSYRETIVSLGKDLEEDQHNNIYNEMMTNHNVRHSNDAAHDATINFQAAHIALLQKNGPNPKANPLDKNDGKKTENLGGPADTESDTKTIKVPKLDKDAAEFVRRTGMKDEDVARALDGEAPVALFRGRI